MNEPRAYHQDDEEYGVDELEHQYWTDQRESDLDEAAKEAEGENP